MTKKNIISIQKEICIKYEAEFIESPNNLKVGISLNIKQGILPINGFRHKPEKGTTGWFIYAGEELSSDANFFQPLHVDHLHTWHPLIEKYLGLAPGWRFLTDGIYEDVWYDESLINM